MKNTWLKIFGAIALVAAMSISGWAKSNKTSIEVPYAVLLNGTQIPAGTYNLKWDGEGSDVKVSVLKGSKVLATSPAKLVDQGKKQSRSTLMLNPASSGPSTISEIHIEGRRDAFVFDNGASAQSGDNGKQ